MKVETFIKRYAAKNTEPDQKYCPIFGIYWRGHNKTLGDYQKIYVPFNGKIYVNEIPEIVNPTGGAYYYANTISPRSYGYDGVYAKNIGHDVLEVAYVRMKKSNRGQEGEIRKWEYLGDYKYYNSGNTIYRRFFITKGDFLPYNSNGERIWEKEDGRYYNRELVRTLGSICSYGRFEPAKLKKTLTEFCGVESANVGWRNAEIPLERMWSLATFIMKSKERKKSKATLKLADYKFPEREYNDSVVEFDIVDDTYAVFRIFLCEKVWDFQNRVYRNQSNAHEKCRVFISNKGKPTIMECDVNKEWRVTSKQLSSIVWPNTKTNHVGFERLQEWKPIDWNLSLVKRDDQNDVEFVRNLVCILRHPVIEKLYKMGYTTLANHAMGDEANNRLKQMFGMEKINEKSRNIYKALGVNKYMLESVNREYNSNHYYGKHNIIYMKEIFGREDITDLSKETIELYTNGLLKCNRFGWRNLIGNNRYYWRNEDRFANAATDEQRRLLEKLFRLEQKEEGIVEAYGDARSLYNRLRNRPEIDWTDFRHFQDVVQLHDNLQGLIDIQEAEQRRLYAMRDAERKAELEKKFKKLQEDRIEKFESHGEKYSIVVPHDLTEITTEGVRQHHCVGGYLDSHANGRTNIMFLRNNERPDDPFYTIEVNPNNYVVQIHGKYNKWLGNDPDAISFVWKWIQDRGLECEKYKLLDTSTGYGKSGKEVSESYLTA